MICQDAQISRWDDASDVNHHSNEKESNQNEDKDSIDDDNDTILRENDQNTTSKKNNRYNKNIALSCCFCM